MLHSPGMLGLIDFPPPIEQGPPGFGLDGELCSMSNGPQDRRQILQIVRSLGILGEPLGCQSVGGNALAMTMRSIRHRPG